MYSYLIIIAGWIGLICVLLAYYLISRKKLTSQSRVYQLLNFFGALGLFSHTFMMKAWPSVLANIIWAVIAFQTLIFIRKSKKSIND